MIEAVSLMSKCKRKKIDHMYESIRKNVLTVDRRSSPLSQLTVSSPGVNVSGAEVGGAGPGAYKVQTFPVLPFRHLVSA